MNPIIKENYFKEVYQQFKDISSISVSKPNYAGNQFVTITDINKEKRIIPHNCYYITSEKQFLDAIKERSPMIEVKEHTKFFIRYYQAYPKIGKELLKLYTSFHSLHLVRDYDTLFPEIITDKKELLPTILSLSSKDFSLTFHKEFSKLDTFLDSYHCTEKEKNIFWEKYFFNKPKLIKDLKYVEQVKNFLLEKYSHDKEQLKKYLPIIPSLKNDIVGVSQEDKKSVFIKPKSVIIYSHINLHKVIEVFGISCSHVEHMNITLNNFVGSFSKHYNIKNTETITTKEKNIKVIMTHTNEKIDQQFFENTMISFFDFLKDNKGFDNRTESISSWLLSNRLLSELDNKTDIKRNKL